MIGETKNPFKKFTVEDQAHTILLDKIRNNIDGAFGGEKNTFSLIGKKTKDVAPQNPLDPSMLMSVGSEPETQLEGFTQRQPKRGAPDNPWSGG